MLQLLKSKGFRITKPRKSMVEVLSHDPCTAEELFILLKKKKVRIDLVSVYRTLELFCKLGFIRPIEFGDGKKRYELVHEDNHHHHIICKTCGKVEDIKLDEDILLTSVKYKTKFKIDSHNLEFFGECLKCK